MSDIIIEMAVEEAKPEVTPPQITTEERPIVFEEALEAILFAAGHPISYATLARVFESTPAKIKEQVQSYCEIYNNSEIPRGVILLTYGDSCQLCTKKYYLNEIREALGIRKSGSLSTSSMEALAIVAYNQPVTRVFVDTLRRVDSSYAMNNLIDRGLIESKGRLDAPGRPMLYGTTPDFLRAFGLSTIEALPQTPEEIKAMFARLDGAEEAADEANDTQISLDDALLEVAPTANEAESTASEIIVEEKSATDEPKTTDEERTAEDDRFNDDM
ncbi:MAG: SMC-Scp complex subunit ScpB [Clostridia bacterium]|nr:SMC-Scp complex subunit ScpB [Clostridia bacterium]